MPSEGTRASKEKKNKDQALADNSSVCRGGGLVTGIDPGAALRTPKVADKKIDGLIRFPGGGVIEWGNQPSASQ